MRAWYDVSFGDLEGKTKQADEKGVRASQAEIEKLIAREVDRGIAAEKIVIAGFSQGGAIALHTGLRHAEKLAGIMALSTYLPVAHTLPAEAAAANRSIPVFYAHGTHDQVIPIAMAEASRKILDAAGYHVEWHSYPMQHSVCIEEIADISAWLVSVLR
jgi:phospholipase/carboxylesterase